MKSSPRMNSSSATELLTAWQPPDLGGNLVVASTDAQKELIQAIFHTLPQPGIDTSARRSQSGLRRLHLDGAGANFEAWLPGDVSKAPAAARPKPEWTFLTLPDLYQPPVEDKSTTVEIVAEAVATLEPHPHADEEAREMLDRARSQAEEIILAAQMQADDILLQAEDEIAHQKKAAYQQGRDQAELEMKEVLKVVGRLVGDVTTWQTNLLGQAEKIMVEMVKEIAQTMFGEGVKLDSAGLQMNLNRIMESAQGLGDLNIFMNPRDSKLLDPSWSEYQLLVSGDRIKIIPSDKIVTGGCFIKGKMGSVDGRVETQLKAVLKTFEDDTKSNG